MKKLSRQKQAIYNLFQDGEWKCSTAIHFIRDYRKRISEMNRANLEEKGVEMFDSMPCDKRCGQNHASNIHMYRLKEKPKQQIVTPITLPDGTRGVRVSYA